MKWRMRGAACRQGHREDGRETVKTGQTCFDTK